MILKLENIAKTKDVGTYVAVTYTDESIQDIMQFARSLNVPSISKTQIHTTVIFSRTKAVGLTASQEGLPATVTGQKLHKFDSPNGKTALVLLLDAPILKARHDYIMKEYNTTYDFDEYLPHITLSYDCADFDIDACDCVLPTVTIESEYVEDLNLNWNENAES